MIDSRSKFYAQLSELNDLNSTGVITEDEYLNEKGGAQTVEVVVWHATLCCLNTCIMINLFYL